jgi:hypothetical protein
MARVLSRDSTNLPAKNKEAIDGLMNIKAFQKIVKTADQLFFEPAEKSKEAAAHDEIYDLP